jgi:hypothetical protein
MCELAQRIGENTVMGNSITPKYANKEMSSQNACAYFTFVIKALKEKRNNSMTLIQKYLRGYVQFKKYELNLCRVKLRKLNIFTNFRQHHLQSEVHQEARYQKITSAEGRRKTDDDY